MSQHTKQQLIDLAIDRNIPYYRLTKAQLASKLNITITPKPPQTPQQKKDYRAAYRLKNSDRATAYAREYYLKNHDTISQKACEYYFKNQDTIDQKAREYRTANPAKKHKWNMTYFDKQNRRTTILRAHGVPYLTPGDPYPGDRRLWDRSTVPFAKELTKAAAAYQTRSRAAPRSLAPLPLPTASGNTALCSQAAPRSLTSDTGKPGLRHTATEAR